MSGLLIVLVRSQRDEHGLDVVCDEGRKFVHVGFDFFEVFCLFACFFIHIERFVDFKLQGVAAKGRGGVAADEFYAFERVVDGYAVA